MFTNLPLTKSLRVLLRGLSLPFLHISGHTGNTRPPCRIDNLWVLLPQFRKVLLSVPIPDTVARKHEINLLKCPLVGFGVERPYNDDRKDIDATEDIESLLIETRKDGW